MNVFEGFHCIVNIPARSPQVEYVSRNLNQNYNLSQTIVREREDVTADLSGVFVLYVVHEGCFLPLNFLELNLRLLLTVVVVGILANYRE